MNRVVPLSWTERCGDVYEAKAWRPSPLHAANEPATEVFDVLLYCSEVAEHDGPHACTLPHHAGADAGKRFMSQKRDAKE